MHCLLRIKKKKNLILCGYLRETNSVESDVEFIINLTTQQIASITGLRVETVIRTIKKLQAANVLAIFKGKIVLSNTQ